MLTNNISDVFQNVSQIVYYVPDVIFSANQYTIWAL